MNNFGEFLYFLRKEKGMTQSELANILGVSNKAVSKWETGDAMPETSLLLPIARIFDVTVDELLDGKRTETKFEKNKTEERQDQEASHDDKEKDNPSSSIKDHLFTRGKDENKTMLDLISGAVCTSVSLLGVFVYLVIGLTLNLWNPTWVIMPVCALSCGIIGIAFDFFNKQKRMEKIKNGTNPYVGGICGIVMLVCIITFLLVGALFNLWHPYWIIVVCGAFTCAVIGSFGAIYTHKKSHNKNFVSKENDN